MPERPDPDLNQVRDAMRAHDDAQRTGEEQRPAEDGVRITQLDAEGEDRFQRLRRELGVSAFGLNLIRLRPRQRGRIHSHDRQEEVYLVLEGTLTLEVEGEPRELGKGSLARVPPAVRRRLTNRGADLLLLLAIGGAGPHEGRDGRAFASWDDHEGAAPQDIPLPSDLDE